MKHCLISIAVGATLIIPAAAFAGASALGGPAMPSHSAASPFTPSATPQSQGAFTVQGPTLTGQPNQSCGSPTAPNTPGNSASAPGSAFNPTGQAGSVYAGEQPQNSGNPASVSQYDVACFRQP